MTTVMVVNTALMAGYAAAFKAGARISQGFAVGMKSQLAIIRNAATQLAALADKAIRAKAKIHSPSRVSRELGAYWGQAFGLGMLDTAAFVRDASEQLVSIPSVAAANVARYGGELATEYSYSRSADYTIEVPLTVDGKEFARATAHYSEAELNRRNIRESRKHGIV
jgi:hypothetical protein